MIMMVVIRDGRETILLYLSVDHTQKTPYTQKVCHHTVAEHDIYLMFDQKSIAPTLTKEVPTQRLIARQMSKDVYQPPSSEFSKI